MPNQPPQDYRAEVLSRMLLLPPSGFERLAQRMLREAGFIQVTVTGKSNDGGIDGFGTLRVNRLVSLKVLFQCKRYKDTVSPAAVRDFRGAMQGRADKGIILTTGTFTEAARKEAGRDGAPQVELIDGEGLISILEDLELGLRRIATYAIDPSFFSAFEST
jgi:restriction system protein